VEKAVTNAPRMVFERRGPVLPRSLGEPG